MSIKVFIPSFAIITGLKYSLKLKFAKVVKASNLYCKVLSEVFSIGLLTKAANFGRKFSKSCWFYFYSSILSDSERYTKLLQAWAYNLGCRCVTSALVANI